MILKWKNWISLKIRKLFNFFKKNKNLIQLMIYDKYNKLIINKKFIMKNQKNWINKG